MASFYFRLFLQNLDFSISCGRKKIRKIPLPSDLALKLWSATMSNSLPPLFAPGLARRVDSANENSMVRISDFVKHIRRLAYGLVARGFWNFRAVMVGWPAIRAEPDSRDGH